MRLLSLLGKLAAAAAAAALALLLHQLAGRAGWIGPRVALLEALPAAPGSVLVARDLGWENDDPVSRRLSHFYVDDPAALGRLRQAWVSGGPAPYFLCGYNYELSLVSGGEVLRSYFVNLERGCNTVVDSQGSAHWFDPRLIERFEGDYKKPVVETASFPDLAAARRRLAEVRGDPRFLMALEPDWRRFDGEFSFDTACDASPAEGASAEACLAAKRAAIRRAHPEAGFEASAGAETYRDGKLLNLTVVVAAREDLRRAFAPFPVKEGSWRPYKPELTLVLRP